MPAPPSSVSPTMSSSRGFVASDHEVFGLFSEVDAFCYPLDEGLTARRSSVLTCVQSGKPLIVTGPALAEEFDHHPRFKELIDRGAIVLVARGSDNEAYADRIVSALKWPTGRMRRSISTAGGRMSPKAGAGAALSVTPWRETAPDNAGRTPRPGR